MDPVDPIQKFQQQFGTPAPFFQPIVSVADGLIYSYEVLGRGIRDGQVSSLGPFFLNDDIDLDERMLIDRIIREKAIHRIAAIPGADRLFINIHPAWIFNFQNSAEEFPSIRMLREAGLHGDHLTIEITEQTIHLADFDRLNRLIDRYREQNIKIAVDDFSYPDFDRLISIKPDFVKLDIRLFKKGVESEDYRKLIEYIASFSLELGISVVFEGVENLSELELAIECGGNYIQGFFLSEPIAEPRDDRSRYRDTIQLGLNNVYYRQINDLQNIMKIEKNMNRYLTLVLEREQVFQSANLDDGITRILDFVPPQCFRLFVCDAAGVQRSSNFVRDRDADSFQIQPEYRGYNWCWRPYFLNNLVRMREYHQGVVSEKYIDVETRHYTLTYSHPISEDLFLFLDFFSNT
ncbi:MAG: EAL domain-containing protein [Leptospiraceae bacterium]|nr:EAL domain-containing protein [Leptospiraceae bacterium]